MSQSSFIVGALLAGFVLFLAAKGRLGTYTSVLFGNTAAPVGTAAKSGGGLSGTLKTIGSVAKTVATVAEFAG